MKEKKANQSIFRKFDFFGESFNFRYKDEDKQATAISGIICLSFYLLAFIYILYNFIPFFRRENFDLQYYTVNSNEGDTINLNDDFITFGFNISVEEDECEELSTLFNIKVEFITQQGSSKSPENIIPHECQKGKDFPEHISEYLYKNLKCIDRVFTPKGIFTDKEFSYYKISVTAKWPNSDYYFKKIEENFAKCDAKLQFYYTDIEIDFNNKSNPFRGFLNSIFLQLNPTLIQKKK